MQFWKFKFNLKQLQVLIWIAVLLLIFFSLLPMDGVTKSLIYTFVNTSSYAIIIYGNILILYPLFYEKGRLITYVSSVTIFLVLTGMLRGYASNELYRHLLLLKLPAATVWALLGYVPGGVLIYVLSLVFRISIAYFTIKQQAEEIMLQKSQAELNLLKSQVQPHFLFNTLNNIYYKVYRVDPLSAGLIERLSEIMRYFVDESPKEIVPIATEVAFLENYMALEKIRIRHGATVDFEKAYDAELRIPPMLLMTFIENIFKHGIDKSLRKNQVSVSLVQTGGYLFFKTVNRKVTGIPVQQPSGFGIPNLTKRLKMLYGSNFELKIDSESELYTALLKIPVS